MNIIIGRESSRLFLYALISRKSLNEILKAFKRCKVEGAKICVGVTWTGDFNIREAHRHDFT